MIQYVIYKNVSDYPEFKYVVRPFRIEDGHINPLPPLIATQSLDNARVSIPKGLVMIDRLQDDDPCIVEVWI